MMKNTTAALAITTMGAALALCLPFIPPSQADTFLGLAGAIATGGIGVLGTDRQRD